MDAKLVGGKIITMDVGYPTATAVAIRGGRIVAVGEDQDVRAVEVPGAELIDLGGRTVLPGLVDSHVHALDTGLQHAAIDLADAVSVADVCDNIAREAPRFPHGWVYAMRCATWGLRERRYPTITELDAVCPDQPVFVCSVTGHSGATNSAGLRIIEAGAPGLSRPAPASPEESGWFPDDISLLAASSVVFGALDRQELAGLYRSVAERAAAKGVTTLHCLEGQATQGDKDVMVLHGISGALPVRVVLMYQTMDVERVLGMGLPRIGGCLCVDGACFENTACFYEPYLDKPDTRGSLNYTADEVRDFVRAAHEAGLQIGMHAIGDRAIDVLTRAYAAAQVASPRPGMRHRVEHFQAPTTEAIAIASQLRLALPMQPIFSYLWDRPEANHYVRQFGEARADGMESFARLLAKGLVISGGSDSPVTDIDPLLGVHSAANNPRASRRTSVAQALRMFTCNGAWVAHDENEYGTLAPGKSADIVVLGGDPFEESEAIADIPVTMTISRGDVTFCTDDLR
jgi:predicted amidohydrolase YtcJ